VNLSLYIVITKERVGKQGVTFFSKVVIVVVMVVRK
jgi:hypothetical protein